MPPSRPAGSPRSRPPRSASGSRRATSWGRTSASASSITWKAVPRLEGAADYLGLTEAELHERLRNGQTLAEIARAEGKSVDGLEQALVAAGKERLDQAVEAGRITAAQRDELLERLEAKIDALVNGTPFLEKRGPGFGHRFGGPMDSSFVPLAPPDA